MAVYGAASLTGGWLGTPPWWERRAFRPIEGFIYSLPWDPSHAEPGTPEWARRNPRSEEDARQMIERMWRETPQVAVTDSRPGREWISFGFMIAGTLVVAVGAWPRRRSGAAS